MHLGFLSARQIDNRLVILPEKQQMADRTRNRIGRPVHRRRYDPNLFRPHREKALGIGNRVRKMITPVRDQLRAVSETHTRAVRTALDDARPHQHRLPQKIAHEGRCRMGIEFDRRADLFDLTIAHNRDTVG